MDKSSRESSPGEAPDLQRDPAIVEAKVDRSREAATDEANQPLRFEREDLQHAQELLDLARQQGDKHEHQAYDKSAWTTPVSIVVVLGVLMLFLYYLLWEQGWLAQ